MNRTEILKIFSIVLLLLVTLTSCAGVENKVAVIYLNGPVQTETGGILFLTGNAITPRMVKSQLNKANEDWAVKGIVLRIESPGGNVAACQEILKQIDVQKNLSLLALARLPLLVVTILPLMPIK